MEPFVTIKASSKKGTFRSALALGHLGPVSEGRSTFIGTYVTPLVGDQVNKNRL